MFLAFPRRRNKVAKDCHCQHTWHVVGLPDKAVSEARERVRAALTASGLALPARRIIVNLAPADLPKEGSHYDLLIALGLMAAIGRARPPGPAAKAPPPARDFAKERRNIEALDESKRASARSIQSVKRPAD
jgi:hypothetical protein